MADSLQIKNIMPRHEAIVDWEILNPGRSAGACAEAMEVGECHLSVIRHSDAFIAYRSKRMKEHHANVSVSVVAKVEDLARLSVEILTDRFDSERATVPLGGVRDTCEMALKALGFGQPAAQKAPGNTMNVIFGADAEMLESAREKMKTVNASHELNEAAEIGSTKPHSLEEETIPAVEVLPPA